MCDKKELPTTPGELLSNTTDSRTMELVELILDNDIEGLQSTTSMLGEELAEEVYIAIGITGNTDALRYLCRIDNTIGRYFGEMQHVSNSVDGGITVPVMCEIRAVVSEWRLPREVLRIVYDYTNSVEDKCSESMVTTLRNAQYVLDVCMRKNEIARVPGVLNAYLMAINTQELLTLPNFNNYRNKLLELVGGRE